MLDIEIKSEFQIGIGRYSGKPIKGFVLQMRHGEKWRSAGIEMDAMKSGVEVLNCIQVLICTLFQAHGLLGDE
jgi:hypothetical protein